MTGETAATDMSDEALRAEVRAFVMAGFRLFLSDDVGAMVRRYDPAARITFVLPSGEETTANPGEFAAFMASSASRTDDPEGEIVSLDIERGGEITAFVRTRSIGRHGLRVMIDYRLARTPDGWRIRRVLGRYL